MTSGKSVPADVAFVQSALGKVLATVRAEGSASHRSIADYLMRNPMRGTALKIEEMADGCQVSTATISRFARDIGFASYGAMRSALAETLHTAMQPVEKLRTSIARRKEALSPGETSMEYARVNLAAAQDANSQQVLDMVARQISGARTVYVLGMGMSSSLAAMLALHLQPFCQHVVEMAGPGGAEVAAGHLVHIGRGDVLVALSFPRYSADTMRFAQFARDHKARVVAITDVPSAPMVALADQVLYASSAHGVLPSSGVATVAVIEALVVSLMVSSKANVKKAARLTEVIGEYLVNV
ncbi:DNA-binding transcriptional regulator, MurR/RpiR family, contains HTH and SIS domains [Duganella sacchari]|uniref:DNA-binding transcriptional regulator, MurR/RpiR family, contains HTH and SIS domains n=1 Tax=Duganella sacchari TaxID=551987 RepID=A0A1M7LB07_9BURK|nr:MurR/RpiR family transcriptional regulator [Duganella sacchari]SHM75193.1 DNA-binding transcriptional regulator, MurR/RpiR family, contains HTH and SIS domains [Duganella sacchari]